MTMATETDEFANFSKANQPPVVYREATVWSIFYDV